MGSGEWVIRDPKYQIYFSLTSVLLDNYWLIIWDQSMPVT